MEWNSPNLKYANFSVQKFRDVFIPKLFQVGTVWELIPIAMGQTGNLIHYRNIGHKS